MAAPLEYRIGNRQHLLKSDLQDFDGDERGIIWLFEPPNPRARYVIGVDATQGRTGWSRFNRTEDDSQIDNGAIEIFKLGHGEPCKHCDPLTYNCTSTRVPHWAPDIQVAEYAAPIDPYDLASVANALGRLYCGRDEDAQAYMIVEVYPGPGGPTQRTLMEKYGYTNFYRWQYLDTGEPKETKMEYGWYSSKTSMQHLWTRGLRFLHRRQIIIKSQWLVEELADCEMDLIKMRGSASSGNHDDRATATLLAIWAGHNWTFNMEPDTTTRAQEGPVAEWQSSAVSSEEMYSQWDERFEEISAEAERDYGI